MSLEQSSAPPRRSHGCLLGCLAAIAIVLLPILLMSAYAGWFFYQGFRRDPVLLAVGELLRHDGMAQLVLGDHIEVTGIEGDSFAFAPGLGSHNAYRAALAGSKASGVLAVEADTDRGHVHIDSMILTGPDGARYDLMQHRILSPGSSGAPTISI